MDKAPLILMKCIGITSILLVSRAINDCEVVYDYFRAFTTIGAFSHFLAPKCLAMPLNITSINNVVSYATSFETDKIEHYCTGSLILV